LKLVTSLFSDCVCHGIEASKSAPHSMIENDILSTTPVNAGHSRISKFTTTYKISVRARPKGDLGNILIARQVRNGQ
jgi:hypothetical protein